MCAPVYEWIEWDGKLQTWRRILFSNRIMSIQNFCKCLKTSVSNLDAGVCVSIYYTVVAKRTEERKKKNNQKLTIISNVCCLSCFFFLLI